MFGTTTVVKNSDMDKWLYSGYGIALDGKDEWSLEDDYGSNVVTFGTDTSSWFHIDDHKNRFLLLGQGDTFGINGSFGPPQKKV